MPVTNPHLFVMVDDEPEFDINEKLPFIEFLGIDVDTPSLSNNYQDSTGQDGSLFTSALINKSTVNIRLAFNFGNYQDLKSKTYQVNQFFYRKKVFRLRTSAQPNMVQFCRTISFDVQPIADGANDCLITIPMENPTGYKFSRYDSLNQVDLWDNFPLGWDIPVMDREDFHFKNEVRFNLLNPSGVPIDPYQERHDFKAIVTYTGDEFSIVNYTSGTKLTIKRASQGNETFVINGCNVFLNSQNINNDTDFGNVKLETGFNDIHIIGSINYDLQFEFPFIYV